MPDLIKSIESLVISYERPNTSEKIKSAVNATIDAVSLQ